MKIRRILCCCTALLLLVLTLAACTGGGETGTSSAPVSTSSAESQPNAEKSIEDYVEKKDYGGRTFTILSPRMNADNKSETEYVKNEYADNYEGEKLAARVNDAIEARNHLVEEYLNVEIVEQRLHETSRPGGTMLTTVRNEIIAGGSQNYQVINPCLYDCGTLAAEGALYNLYTVSTLNGLEADWWDHTFNGDVSFGDKLYFTNGDMGFQSKSSTAIVVFNRDLQTEYSLEDPYTLVREGTWTIDKAIESGATPDSVDVHIEIDPQTSKLTAIALGSTEVKTTDLLKECTREEAAQLAADDLKATTAEVKLEGATKNFFVYGLDRKNKHPLRILDKKGFIKVQRNDGKAVLCKAGSYRNIVSQLWEELAIYQQDAILRPDYYICAGARVMDFSGSVDLDKIMMLMEVEMQMINPGDDVIIVGAKNSL